MSAFLGKILSRKNIRLHRWRAQAIGIQANVVGSWIACLLACPSDDVRDCCTAATSPAASICFHFFGSHFFSWISNNQRERKQKSALSIIWKRMKNEVKYCLSCLEISWRLNCFVVFRFSWFCHIFWKCVKIISFLEKRLNFLFSFVKSFVNSF